MPLSPGTTLGSYHVTAKIGEGGMGEVYRARDTKLDRDVALKVLPQAFTDDPDRLARFEREAKVLASLNHPNIGHIYGLEEAEGTRALVLELIEGPTLADRIAKGPIPLDEALPIAKQIAEALEAAHEAGVIHRDLKPANVKVKSDGTVKVLDFGLAKALDTTPEGDPSLSPTLTAAATQMGVIMGTAAYMSPEQARGKPVDKRADIWAFGAVLFEMLTGKRAFGGEDVSVTLADVIRADPAWELLPDAVSPSLQTYLGRCLHKDPTQRVQAIGDLRLALEGAFETTVVVPSAGAATTQPAGWRQALPWVAGIMLAVIASATVWTLMRPAPQPLTRFWLLPPAGVQLHGSVKLAPDGQTVAFIGLNEGQPQVYVRALDQLAAVPVRGTEGMNWVMDLSPDGQWLLGTDSNFTALNRVPLAGGPADTVARGGIVLSAWGPDDTIVQGSTQGLWSVPAFGGERTQLTTLAEGENLHSATEFLPNGRAVLFHAFLGGEPDNAQVAVFDIDTGQITPLLRGTTPSFTPTGHLVFWRDGSLWGVPFDADRLVVRGSPARVVDGVSSVLGVANYALADNGTLVYLPGETSGTNTIGWVDRKGVMTTPLVDGFMQPRLSPGGTRVALERPDGLWIRDLESGRETNLSEGLQGIYPAWTPDDTSVTFGAAGGNNGLYVRPVDRSSQTDTLLSAERAIIPGAWTPDGQTLIYYVVNEQGDRDIWTLPVGGDPVPFLATEFNEKNPRLSPNGKWLAYVSDQPGEDRVFVRAFPEGEGEFPVSTGLGTEAVWSRDGKELFYRNANQMWVVEVETDTQFTAGSSELLFEAPYVLDVAGNPNYDVSLDGEHFLMEQRVGLADQTQGFTPARVRRIWRWRWGSRPVRKAIGCASPPPPRWSTTCSRPGTTSACCGCRSSSRNRTS